MTPLVLTNYNLTLEHLFRKSPLFLEFNWKSSWLSLLRRAATVYQIGILTSTLAYLIAFLIGQVMHYTRFAINALIAGNLPEEGVSIFWTNTLD